MNKKYKPIFFMFILGLVGAAAGYAVAKSSLIDAVLPAKEQMSWMSIVYIILIFEGVVAIHELGHLLTGLVQGFRFEMFVVGFLGIKRVGEKVKVYFNTDMNTFGGLAATAPHHDDPKVISKMAKLVIAGPLASLVLLVVCIAGFFLTNQPTQFYLFIMGLMTLFIFLATTLPSKTGIFYTDRKRYQRLTKPGKSREVEVALFRANTLFLTGKSIREMPESELWTITEDESHIFQYTGFYYLRQYHQDNPEKHAEMNARLDEIEPHIPPSIVAMMKTETTD
ncbi:MAG: M50 family metallopeptidase [Bacteroidia bacterium]